MHLSCANSGILTVFHTLLMKSTFQKSNSLRVAKQQILGLSMIYISGVATLLWKRFTLSSLSWKTRQNVNVNCQISSAGQSNGFVNRRSSVQVRHLALCHFIMNDSSNYVFGGFPVTSVNILRLISELEGSYQLTKYMGFKEDMDTLEEIKKRYYKLYFKLAKEEKSCQVMLEKFHRYDTLQTLQSRMAQATLPQGSVTKVS